MASQVNEGASSGGRSDGQDEDLERYQPRHLSSNHPIQYRRAVEHSVSNIAAFGEDQEDVAKRGVKDVESQICDEVFSRLIVLHKPHEKQLGVVGIPKPATEQVCRKITASEIQCVVLHSEIER